MMRAQVPVHRPEFQETTSLGAALAAGLAVGFWDEAAVFSHPKDRYAVFSPQASPENVAQRYEHWKIAVQRSLDLAQLAEGEEEGADSKASTRSKSGAQAGRLGGKRGGLGGLGALHAHGLRLAAAGVLGYLIGRARRR